MATIIKCTNKIRTRKLNNRDFKEHGKLLKIEYSDLFLYCGFLLRGQVLNRFRKLKDVIHNFLERKKKKYLVIYYLIDNLKYNPLVNSESPFSPFAILTL